MGGRGVRVAAWPWLSARAFAAQGRVKLAGDRGALKRRSHPRAAVAAQRLPPPPFPSRRRGVQRGAAAKMSQPAARGTG